MVFPSGGDFYVPNFAYNLGSAYIIGYLRKSGYVAEQFIANDSFNVEVCVKKILKHNPKIVGFTVYDSNYMQCALISNGLKTYNSDILIIFGGPTPSVQSKTILENVLSVDICVKWEGEETLVNLLNRLTHNEFKLDKVDLSNIKGIAFRKDKKIVINPDSKVLLLNKCVKDYLDNYPSPYLTKIIPTSEAARTGIITARGCNQNCIYCNSAVISNRNIFFHSIDRVIEELKLLSKNSDFIGPVPIMDDAFTIIPDRARQICERILENEINIPLSFITRCDKINEDLLDLMKQTGFISVGFSLESAVPRVLRSIGKVNPPNSKANFDKEKKFIERLNKMTNYAKKIGMSPVFVSIMVGLPGESLKDAKKTMKLVSQLNMDFYAHNYLHIFKGTPLYQNHLDYGYKITAWGKNNNIITHNDFPFDINKVKLAPKSEAESNRKVIDYKIQKIISLIPKREDVKPYFDNIIINSDIIKPNLIKWIQGNLKINGTIVHLYSDRKNFNKYNITNNQVLYNDLIPTMFYECYYQDYSKNKSLFRSKVMASSGDQIGLVFALEKTYSALEEYIKGKKGMENTICIDLDSNDAQSLYKYLIRVLNSGDGLNYLLESAPLPHLQTLCRWTSNHANCKKLETAIIDNEDNIRFCWQMDPIGKVGDKFDRLLENLQKIYEEQVRIRNCINCSRYETCIKCVCSKPLTFDKYCEFKRKNNTIDPAKIINSVDILKDLMYKQINRFDF